MDFQKVFLSKQNRKKMFTISINIGSKVILQQTWDISLQFDFKYFFFKFSIWCDVTKYAKIILNLKPNHVYSKAQVTCHENQNILIFFSKILFFQLHLPLRMLNFVMKNIRKKAPVSSYQLGSIQLSYLLQICSYLHFWRSYCPSYSHSHVMSFFFFHWSFPLNQSFALNHWITGYCFSRSGCLTYILCLNETSISSTTASVWSWPILNTSAMLPEFVH